MKPPLRALFAGVLLLGTATSSWLAARAQPTRWVGSWAAAQQSPDAVVDFDRVVVDPGHPDELLPAYDSGDHLHPSPAGYKAMADAVPIRVFAGGASGTTHAGAAE